MSGEVTKVENYHLRLPHGVLLSDSVLPFVFFENLWCGRGRKATVGSMDAENNLPLDLCDFAVTVQSCVKQIVLYKHLFKLIEKLFCIGC